MTFAPTSFVYDAETDTLTVGFQGLYDGNYTLTTDQRSERVPRSGGDRVERLRQANRCPPAKATRRQTTFVLNFYVDAAGDLPYPSPLGPKAPLGSLIFDPSVRGTIHAAGDSDGYAMRPRRRANGDCGPGDARRAAGIDRTVRDPDGTSVATATATTPDQDVVLQTAPAVDAGTYRVLIGGAVSSTGGYTARLILNAADEVEEHGGPSNDDLGSGQDLSGAVVDLEGGLQRAAVLGKLDGLAGPDLYSLVLDGGEVVSSVVTATSTGSLTLELLDAAGMPLALGLSGYGIVNRAISDFVAPRRAPITGE